MRYSGCWSERSITEERGEEVGMSRNAIVVAIVVIVVVVFVYLILRFSKRCLPGRSGSGLYTAPGRAFRDLPSLARPSLCALEALRWGVGDETMTTPGGTRTACYVSQQLPRARRTGFYHRVGAPTSDPSLSPDPMLQGVSYVQNSVVYIRNIIPDTMSIAASASLAYRGGAILSGRASRLSRRTPYDGGRGEDPGVSPLPPSRAVASDGHSRIRRTLTP